LIKARRAQTTATNASAGRGICSLGLTCDMSVKIYESHLGPSNIHMLTDCGREGLYLGRMPVPVGKRRRIC
jgi:hypothetical protein